jgi:glycosyltransferase involved in cell wall biosynthesis
MEWDNVALEEATRRFTTSREVARRLERFNGITGEPLYHPPPLHDELHDGPFGDYVFCATRLERNKRPDLLVDALPHLRTPTRAVIAGRGTLHGTLRSRDRSTGTGARLELPGFVPDDEPIKSAAVVLTRAGCSPVRWPWSTRRSRRTTATSRCRPSWPASR